MQTPHLNYDQIAPEYNQRYPSPQPSPRGQALIELARQTQAQTILEVGSGTGFWLNLLHQVAPNLYGLDYSAGMLAQARRRPAPLKLTRGSAMRFPYPDHFFDFVYCVDAIHHFDDQPAFIQEAFRVLKPGGALAVIGFDPHAATTQWYIYEYFDSVRETDLLRYPASQVLLQWMQTEGFERTVMQTAEHIQNLHKGVDVLNDPYLKHSSSSQLALLSPETYQAGMQRVQQAVQERGQAIVFEADFLVNQYVGYKPRFSM